MDFHRLPISTSRKTRDSGEISPPQLPAFAVMAGVSVHGRIPLRPDSAASFPNNLIAGYLSINPVNLSNFIEFFGNSLSPDEASGSAIVHALPPVPAAADAGKCVRWPRGNRSRTTPRAETASRANLSGYFRPPPLPQRQMRANAPTLDAGGTERSPPRPAALATSP